MTLPKYKFPEDRCCPKCQARLCAPTYCKGDCWNGPYCGGSNPVEHLHWKCACTFEWLSPTVELKKAADELSREDS